MKRVMEIAGDVFLCLTAVGTEVKELIRLSTIESFEEISEGTRVHYKDEVEGMDLG